MVQKSLPSYDNHCHRENYNWVLWNCKKKTNSAVDLVHRNIIRSNWRGICTTDVRILKSFKQKRVGNLVIHMLILVDISLIP